MCVCVYVCARTRVCVCVGEKERGRKRLSFQVTYRADVVNEESNGAGEKNVEICVNLERRSCCMRKLLHTFVCERNESEK